MEKVADKLAQFLPTTEFTIIGTVTFATPEGGTISHIITYDPPPQGEAP